MGQVERMAIGVVASEVAEAIADRIDELAGLRGEVVEAAVLSELQPLIDACATPTPEAP